MSGIHNRHGFEDWDSVFEEPEPTRAIVPEPAQHARQFGGHTRSLGGYPHQQGTLPPVRPNRPPQLMGASQAYSTTAQAPYQAANVYAYRRVQFIPSGCGTLVAYSVNTGLFALLKVAFETLGISTYDKFAGAVTAVSTASTQSQALPWAIAGALIWLFSFGCAGYTASRMSAVAPMKQAVGVLAVTCFAVLVATLMTWMTVSLPSPITPPFALQPLLDPDLNIGVLTALATGLLALFGSILGALSGIKYHQRLTRNNP